MFADNVVQLGQLGTLVIGSVGICVALVNQRRQLNAQMFIEFSGRFQELLRLFPTEAWLANRTPHQPLPPPSQELTDCTLYCIQFIADVYYLHHSGYISKKLWMLWEREIRRTLTGPVFVREWDRVAAEFAHNSDFVHYIDSLMRCKRGYQK
jgi:hypothetical protein